jgi:E3 ubiquitin-protein ligase AIP2
MLIPRYTKRRFSLSGDKIEELCSICLENMREKEMAVTPCGHAFHKRCLRTWMNMNNMCPLDRIVLSMEDLRGEL